MDEGFQTHVKHPTAESIRFWEDWVQQHPHKAEAIRQARLIILSVDFRKTPESEIPKEELFQRIQASIYSSDVKVLSARRTFFRNYRRMAAIFIGLIMATASLYLLTYDKRAHYITGYGEIERLTLPDGSKITLNANSSVRFKKSWAEGGSREVELVGEAFFDVVHTKDHDRFIVRTNQADIEVLGTEFNVQTRRMRAQVVLSSGKVKIYRKGSIIDTLYMKPGELVEVNDGKDGMKKATVDPEYFSSWTKGELIFKGTPLGEIARILEDSYGWKATFEDESIRHYRFTGAVSTASVDGISLLLYTISQSFDIRVTRVGDQLTFRKNK